MPGRKPADLDRARKDERFLGDLTSRLVRCIWCEPRAAAALARTCAEHVARGMYARLDVQPPKGSPALKNQRFEQVLENLRHHLNQGVQADKTRIYTNKIVHLEGIQRLGNLAVHPDTHVDTSSAQALVGHLKAVLPWYMTDVLGGPEPERIVAALREAEASGLLEQEPLPEEWQRRGQRARWAWVAVAIVGVAVVAVGVAFLISSPSSPPLTLAAEPAFPKRICKEECLPGDGDDCLPLAEACSSGVDLRKRVDVVNLVRGGRTLRTTTLVVNRETDKDSYLCIDKGDPDSGLWRVRNLGDTAGPMLLSQTISHPVTTDEDDDVSHEDPWEPCWEEASGFAAKNAASNEDGNQIARIRIRRTSGDDVDPVLAILTYDHGRTYCGDDSPLEAPPAHHCEPDRFTGRAPFLWSSIAVPRGAKVTPELTLIIQFPADPTLIKPGFLREDKEIRGHYIRCAVKRSDGVDYDACNGTLRKDEVATLTSGRYVLSIVWHITNALPDTKYFLCWNPEMKDPLKFWPEYIVRGVSTSLQ